MHLRLLESERRKTEATGTATDHRMLSFFGYRSIERRIIPKEVGLGLGNESVGPQPQILLNVEKC